MMFSNIQLKKDNALYKVAPHYILDYGKKM